MTDITPPNLLCSDSELEYLKRAIAGINEATRILKSDNDAACKCFAMPDRPWFRCRPYREQGER